MVRIVDKDAVAQARVTEHECGACGRPPGSIHHVLQKSSPYFGGDVPANLIALCGSGTSGCHGAIHGNPYVDRAGKRWTAEEVRFALGRTIMARRFDIACYVLAKLGPIYGPEYLLNVYGVVLRVEADSTPIIPT